MCRTLVTLPPVYLNVNLPWDGVWYCGRTVPDPAAFMLSTFGSWIWASGTDRGTRQILADRARLAGWAGGTGWARAARRAELTVMK